MDDASMGTMMERMNSVYGTRWEKERVANWTRLLSRISGIDALAALDTWMKTSGQPPRPANILGIVRDGKTPQPNQSKKFAGGERVFSCPVCLDTGWVDQRVRVLEGVHEGVSFDAVGGCGACMIGSDRQKSASSAKASSYSVASEMIEGETN